MLQGQEKYVIDVLLKSYAQNERVEYLPHVHIGPRPIIPTVPALLSETQGAFDWSFSTSENGSWTVPGKGEQEDWKREVWSWVQGKKHSMFYRGSGFPLKTRKKITINHRISGWKGLSSRISLCSWILEVFNVGKSSTSLGRVNTVQSANSFEMFTLLSTYYLRQPGQISLLFKL